VAEWLTNSSAMLEVTGSRPNFSEFLRFFSGIDGVRGRRDGTPNYHCSSIHHVVWRRDNLLANLGLTSGTCQPVPLNAAAQIAYRCAAIHNTHQWYTWKCRLPRTHRQTIGDRAFPVAASQSWTVSRQTLRCRNHCHPSSGTLTLYFSCDPIIGLHIIDETIASWTIAYRASSLPKTNCGWLGT